MALYSLSFMLTTANSHCDRCFWNTLGKTQRTPATMTVRAPGIWGSNTGLMVCRGWPLGKITATTQRYRKQSLKEQKRCFCLLSSLTETMSIQREKKHFANQAELLLNERFTTASCKLFSDSTQQEQKHSGGGAGTREKSGQRRGGRRGWREWNFLS